MTYAPLPLPPHFDPQRVEQIRKIDYQLLADEGQRWQRAQGIVPAARDAGKILLLLIDLQNTFCTPGFELFVAGRSGNAAVEDNIRLCRFIYRHLHCITHISVTMDTHQALQIFHALFWIDDHGRHPDPYTLITAEEVHQGRWRFNPNAAPALGIIVEAAQRYVQHYTSSLAQSGKYDLTVWPYHAMLGGIGHALVPAVEEALFFHTVTRISQTDYHAKGRLDLTEHYSALKPEVSTDGDGNPIGGLNEDLLNKVLASDAVIIAGQAKSHCVAWTVADLLKHIKSLDPTLTGKIYLLEDCASPVVIPNLIDYTDDADAYFTSFAEAGMHLVDTAQPLDHWPGIIPKLIAP
jgi:nicotinamidase-related amidase